LNIVPEFSQFTLGLVRQGLEGLVPFGVATPPFDPQQFWKQKLFDFGFAPNFIDLAMSAYSFNWTDIILDLFSGKFGDKNSYFGSVLPPYFSEAALKKLVALVLAQSKDSGLIKRLRKSLAADGLDIPTSAEQVSAISLEPEGVTDSAEARQPDPQQKGSQMTAIEIFISHSKKDEKIAEALTELLKNALEIDPRAILCTSVEGHRLPVGVRTSDRLKEELLNAKSFVALLTPHSLSSTWVLFELGARWGLGSKLAPLLAGSLTAEKLGGPLPDINALSCTSEADLHQFVQDIAAVIDVKTRGAHFYTRYLKRLIEYSTNPAHEESVARREEPPLMDKRTPKIRALRYGKEPPRGAACLVITNDGEPAYDVSIPDIAVGKSLLKIGCDIARLTHSDGDKLCEAWIVKSPHESALGESLRAEMVAQGIANIDIPIHYKDDENRWYRTLYKLERNVEASGGLVLRYIRQEFFIPESDNKKLTLRSLDPRIYLDIKEGRKGLFETTTFVLNNAGQEVAHRVQIQPMKLHGLRVTFETVDNITVNGRAEVLPDIHDGSPLSFYNIRPLLEQEWNDRGQLTDEMAVPLAITYEDFAKNKFEVTLELVYFPVKDITNRSHLGEGLGEPEPIMKIRMTEFRRLGSSAASSV